MPVSPMGPAVVVTDKTASKYCCALCTGTWIRVSTHRSGTRGSRARAAQVEGGKNKVLELY
jgi:hypothetical protein